MSDSEINYLTQHLGLTPEYWKDWLTNVIGLDPQVLELALKICPSWPSFARLREVKGFLKALTDGKIPTVVNLPSKQGSDDERETSKSKSARKKERKATQHVVYAPVILPALAIENLEAAHRFVRLVCIHTCRNVLRGRDLSTDMLDVFKDDSLQMQKMLEKPEQIPRLTKGSDTINWLGRVRLWARRVPGCTGVPLAYLLRPNADPGVLPALKTDCPFTERDNSDEEGIAADLIQYTSHKGGWKSTDGETLYQHLDNALQNTTFATTVLKYAKTQDGVAVFKSIEESLSHAPQWEERREDNQKIVDTLEPAGDESLSVYLGKLDDALEELHLCETNGHGSAPTDKTLVARILKVTKRIFKGNFDVESTIRTIRETPSLKNSYANAKRELLKHDPHPPSAKASPKGGSRRKEGARISSTSSSSPKKDGKDKASSSKAPTVYEGKSGVWLGLDYSEGDAFHLLSAKHFKELNERNPKGKLPSWKSDHRARDFINILSRRKKRSDKQHVKAKVSAATKSIAKERDSYADGLLSLSKRKASKDRRKDSKRRRKGVTFAKTSAVEGKHHRRRKEYAYDSSSASSQDDSSVSSADNSSTGEGDSGEEDFEALVSSARKTLSASGTKPKSCLVRKAHKKDSKRNKKDKKRRR